MTVDRKPLDLSLYLVTDTALCGTMGVPATVAAAVEAGARVIQLRDPICSDQDYVALGRHLVGELVGSGVPLLVNDRVHLVAAIGAHGAHVGQGDLDVTTARRHLGPGRYLGLSVQTLPQVVTAQQAEGGVIDYLGVGPVWPQSTKPDATGPIGLDQLVVIAAGSPWPCVAIGGIGPGRVRLAREAGAAGVAVVSAVCGQRDPAEATRQLRHEWDEGLQQP